MTQPPIPTLPLRAAVESSTSERRAAPRAALYERDGLIVGAALRAIEGAGYRVGPGGREDVSFVGLGNRFEPQRCRRRPPAPFGAHMSVTVGYVPGDTLLAAVHALHGCADVIVTLTSTSDGPRFEYLAWPHVLAHAGVTAREAEVLALLLERRGNDEVADLLFVSPATVRSHCRSIYCKLGVRDRRALWARFPQALRNVGS